MNLYEILEINENATETDIKKAYHKLALIYHPDKKQGDNEKFQNIQYAYEILINPNTRFNYCKLNKIEQHNFVNFLQKLFSNNLILNELKHFGIKLTKTDWSYLENNYLQLLEKLNLDELINLFKNGIMPRKKQDDITVSETDTEFNESNCEYYFDLPIQYQKYSNLNIFINLNISMDELIQNLKKKIKINRNINNNITENSFIINIQKKYIVFPFCGDIIDNNNGHLIIKLNLPNNIIWQENIIFIEKNITLYEMIYGLDLKYVLNNQEIYIPNWIPARDGLIIDINQFKFKNYILNIKLSLDYDHSENKQKILFEYFN